MGRPDRRAARPHDGELHRAAPQRQGISGVRREPDGGHAGACLQGAGRALRRPRRGRAGGAAPLKRRTVQALGFALAILSGALLALSFPKFGHPACAWLALTPLLVALVRPRDASEATMTSRRAFRLGLVSGGVYFSATLYWLVETMTTFGELQPAVAVVAALLLVAYLSLFPAACAVAVARLSRAFGPGAVLIGAPAWVATELGRQYVWDGFPWALLGYSQITWLPIAQLASIVGVYGLSLLLALTSASAAYLFVTRGSRRLFVAGGVAVLIVASTLWGRWRLQDSSLLRSGEPVRVAVIQANIAQQDKWNPALSEAITNRYLAMSRQALGQGATFVIWPESATPFYFEHDLLRGSSIRRLATEAKATFLFGSDQVEPVRAEPGLPKPKERSYNAAFLVQPDG